MPLRNHCLRRSPRPRVRRLTAAARATAAEANSPQRKQSIRRSWTPRAMPSPLRRLLQRKQTRRDLPALCDTANDAADAIRAASRSFIPERTRTAKTGARRWHARRSRLERRAWRLREWRARKMRHPQHDSDMRARAPVKSATNSDVQLAICAAAGEPCHYPAKAPVSRMGSL